MAQKLKASTAIAEDQSSGPITHIRWLATTSNSGFPDGLFYPPSGNPASRVPSPVCGSALPCELIILCPPNTRCPSVSPCGETWANHSL